MVFRSGAIVRKQKIREKPFSFNVLVSGDWSWHDHCNSPRETHGQWRPGKGSIEVIGPWGQGRPSVLPILRHGCGARFRFEEARSKQWKTTNWRRNPNRLNPGRLFLAETLFRPHWEHR
jgi:hypothetical protein